MLKALIKKQLMELWKGWFINSKKGTVRSRAGVVAYILLYAVLMIGVLGGAFFALSTALCAVMHGAGLDWLYFAFLSLIALLLGVFSGAFTVHTTVYQAKDNDLLLSLPVPVHYILISRLVSVYLMGLLFTALVQVPAIIVYVIFVSPPVLTVVAAVLQMLCVSVLVLVLSCALGWVVAKLSARLKNRNIVKVLASLAFFAIYYVVYFRAVNHFQTILEQATAWGRGVSAASPLHVLGAASVNFEALGVLAAVTAAAWVLTRRIMARSFLTLAVGAQTAAHKKAGKVQENRVGSLSSALLKKEFARFTSNSTYMLNCGLSVLLLPAMGVLVFAKRAALLELTRSVFSAHPESLAVLLCAAVIMAMSMNDLCSAAISLEGKSIWIPQSMPIEPWQVLRSKLSVQVILTLPVAVFSIVLCALALAVPVVQGVLMTALCAVCSVLFAMIDLALNLKMPNLSWTNELYPIKQSGCVAIALFAPWVYALVMGGGYLLVAYPMGTELYVGCFLAASCIGVLLLNRWLHKGGSRIFAGL